jgi:3'-phosphoadenosine 5'-phosphosulfate sulfotransferase (PAPS reductase)/FAD synthetase
MTITPMRMHEAAVDTGRRHIVPLSGGKDSTALSLYLAQKYPDIAFEFVFCDTGAELPETYEYLDRLEHVLGHQITRISALELLEVRPKPGRSAFDIVLFDHFSGKFRLIRNLLDQNPCTHSRNPTNMTQSAGLSCSGFS